MVQNQEKFWLNQEQKVKKNKIKRCFMKENNSKKSNLDMIIAVLAVI